MEPMLIYNKELIVICFLCIIPLIFHGKKVDIRNEFSGVDLTRILKKPATIQEEDNKYKEKQEFHDKILVLEK